MSLFSDSVLFSVIVNLPDMLQQLEQSLYRMQEEAINKTARI